MSRSEKIKEQIGWYKVIFAVFAATFVSLIGWTATHYNSSDAYIIYATLFVILFLSFLLVKINKKAFQMMDELEEL